MSAQNTAENIEAILARLTARNVVKVVLCNFSGARWASTIKRLPLSLPLVCIARGAALFSIPQVTHEPLPIDHPEITERFTEFVVMIAQAL